MSLSDKFYEGLSAPLPVAGAQMPTDLVPYAGSPLDALEQHKQKYKQLEYINRLSNQTSKRLLKQLAKAEADYGEEDMAKISFVGSNPVSRRAYYLQKLAEKPAPITEPNMDPVQAPAPTTETSFADMIDPGGSAREALKPLTQAMKPPTQAPPDAPEQISQDRYSTMVNEIVAKNRNADGTLMPRGYEMLNNISQRYQVQHPPVTQQTAPTQAPPASPSPAAPKQPSFVEMLDPDGSAREALKPLTQAMKPSTQASPATPPPATPPPATPPPATPPPATPPPATPEQPDFAGLGKATFSGMKFPASTPTPNPNSFGQRYVQDGKRQRFLGENQRDLVNSGEFLNRSREMAAAFKGMKKDPRYVSPPEDNRSFFERAKDNLYHYGTRAARGLSTGAQMGASYLYDVADRNNYLDEGSFLGDTLGKENRESLNKEMARINASLGHSYGGKGEDADLYFNRLRGIDTDLGTEGIQAYDYLTNRDKFRDQLIKDRMANYSGRGFDESQKADLRRSAGETIDNYYGFAGNTAGVPSLRDDITGTSFRNALGELQDGSLFTSPAKEQARIATLEEMMQKNPEVYKKILEQFGEAATKANVPLAQYAASQLAKGLQYNNPATSQEKYEQMRKLTTSVLDSMDPQDQGRFIAQMNPKSVQKAQNIAQMSNEKALATINDMDPLEARYLMDQYSLLSKYVSPNMAQTSLDPSKYRVREDRDDWLPSFGGTDLVNPALQQIGAGSDLGDMTGDARDSVYFFNNMREQPTADGQSYLVDDGWLGNTYYNPITRQTNYEFGTDLGRLFSNAPTTHTPLPEKYRQQFYEQEGYYPTYNGR